MSKHEPVQTKALQGRYPVEEGFPEGSALYPYDLVVPGGSVSFLQASLATATGW